MIRNSSPPAAPATFQKLVWSNLAAQSAEQIGLAAAPIVAVLAFGAGPGETGVLQAIQTLPFLLLAIPLGALADQVSRSRLMTVAESLRVVSLLSLLMLGLTGHLSFTLLAGLGFLGACGTVGFSVGAPALVPSLVPREKLPQANGRIELARTASFIVGPALGGLLVAWSGASLAFGAAAALSMLAVLLLAGIRSPTPPRPETRPNIIADIREGAAFVFGHQVLRPIWITQVIFLTAFTLLLAVFVPYAVQNLRMSPTEVGVSLAADGVGAAIGALLAPAISRRLSFRAVICIGPLCGVAAAAAMALTIVVPSMLLAMLSFFLIGAGPILWSIATATYRQTVTPDRLLGRVSAINTISLGARPIGAGLGSLIGSLYGIDACLLAALAGFVLQAAVILLATARVASPGRPATGRVPG